MLSSKKPLCPMDNLTRGDLQALIHEINPLLKDASIRSFQTVASRKFVLYARKEGRVIALLLCLQEPFLRIHLWTGSQKGVSHHLAEKVVEHVIKEIALLNADRIVQITFENQWALIAELFPKRPNLFLITPQKEIIWALNPVENRTYKIPPNPFQQDFIQPTPGITSATVEQHYQKKEFEAEKESLRHTLELKTKKARKELEKALRELERCQQWEAFQHDGQLLQANFHRLHQGLERISVADWTREGVTLDLLLDPELAPKDQIAKRFKLSKKLKAGLPFAEKWVTQAEQHIRQWNAELIQLETIQKWEDLLKPAAIPRAKSLPSQPYHEFQSTSGLKIWVGKAAKSNEKLTFSLAKGS